MHTAASPTKTFSHKTASRQSLIGQHQMSFYLSNFYVCVYLSWKYVYVVCVNSLILIVKVRLTYNAVNDFFLSDTGVLWVVIEFGVYTQLLKHSNPSEQTSLLALNT